MEVTDISLPIYNGMWSYKPEWQNTISTLIHTNKGDAGTVYKFDLCSHTGTYIETSQHKLNNNILLEDYPLSAFYRECIVIIIKEHLANNAITLKQVQEEARRANLTIKKGDYLIIATGYGNNYTKPEYLKASPSFEPELTQWLIEKKIGLIGVDTPVIENMDNPYQPVNNMFLANEKMLLLAPLYIDTKTIHTGGYTLSCLPLPIKNISGCQCRAILIKQ